MDISYTEQVGPCRRISDKAFDSNLQNLLAAVYSVDDCRIACTADEKCIAFGWSDTEGCRHYYPDPTSDYTGDDQITGFKCYIKNTQVWMNGTLTNTSGWIERSMVTVTNTPTLVAEGQICSAYSGSLGTMTVEECGNAVLSTPECDAGLGHFILSKSDSI